jgi:hypothetical protein
MRTYEPKEFIAKARINELSDPTELVIFGLVKADENDAYILFASSPKCADWLPIPSEIIQTIQHLRNAECKDHQHPFVRIVFKRSDEVRPDLALFMTLLSRAQKALALARVAASRNSSMRSNCMVVQGGSGLEICCAFDTPDGGLDVECTGMV